MFWWLIWVLIFIILIANERHSWTDTFSETHPYRTSSIFRRRDDNADWDLSRKYQKQVAPEVVVVTADDLIESPDFRMEKLIKEGRLEEARKYRLDMEKISEDVNDDEGMRRYAVYGARISRRQKELNAQKAKQAYRAHTTGQTVRTEETPVGGPAVPPIWKLKSKANLSGTAAGIEKIEPVAVPVNVEKPKPPEPVITKPKPEPVKSEPSKIIIPEGFVPPPPGPVKLGSIGGYQPGKSVLENSDEPEEGIVEDATVINPDDYTDLISFN